MTTFRIDPSRSTVTVQADSTLHSVKSRGSGLKGQVHGDLEALESSAGGTVSFPMANMSFGDRVRDWSLHRHLNTSQWPEARATIDSLSVIETAPWRVEVNLSLDYRGSTSRVVAHATGSVDDSGLVATARFTLSLPGIGIEPPRFLLLKVADHVTVEVCLYGSPID